MENFANIISNDCTSGFLYQYYGVPYQNPFIWGTFSVEAFQYLMEHWDTIDISNIQYEEHYYTQEHPICSFRIDNAISYNYVHHTRLSGYKSIVPLPNVENVLVFDNMEQYLYDTYQRRLTRMKKSPLFIYNQRYTTEKEDSLANLLQSSSKYPLVLITSHKKLLKYYSENRIIITKDKTDSVQLVASHIKNHCGHLLALSK